MAGAGLLAPRARRWTRTRSRRGVPVAYRPPTDAALPRMAPGRTSRVHPGPQPAAARADAHTHRDEAMVGGSRFRSRQMRSEGL